jgi:hypothetical protein
MIIIFSSQPFYNRYVQRSTADDPVSPKIYENGKLWPFFRGCLGAIDGSHIHISPPLLSKISIAIGKVFFHRIVFSYVISTCSSHTFSQAGKVLQQILGSGVMHWQKDFLHLKDIIILQMPDFLTARIFLFLFLVCGIIFRSGVLQVFGMCFLSS